jgi:hypothetical protein
MATEFVCKIDYSKPVKQEVNGTVILPPSVIPDRTRVRRVQKRTVDNLKAVKAKFSTLS